MFPKIYSKTKLKEYIFRKLGHPVVNIEITEDQLDDVIAEVLDTFIPRAYSGTYESYIPLTIQPAIQSIQLPFDVFAVLDVASSSIGGIGTSGASPSVNPFHINQFIAADLNTGTGKVDMISYEMTFQMIATMNLLMGKRIMFEFNTHSRFLNLHDTITSPTSVFLKVFRRLIPKESLQLNPNYNPADPLSPQHILVEETNIYDNIWVRNMSVEKARLQWSVNMMKYEGSVLPNGGSINVSGIRDMAEHKIETLMNELYNEWELPADFMIG